MTADFDDKHGELDEGAAYCMDRLVEIAVGGRGGRHDAGLDHVQGVEDVLRGCHRRAHRDRRRRSSRRWRPSTAWPSSPGRSGIRWSGVLRTAGQLAAGVPASGRGLGLLRRGRPDPAQPGRSRARQAAAAMRPMPEDVSADHQEAACFAITVSRATSTRPESAPDLSQKCAV